jgi:hypothetical protein
VASEKINITMIPASGSHMNTTRFFDKWGQDSMRAGAKKYASNIVYAEGFNNGISQCIMMLRQKNAGLGCLTIFDHADDLSIGMGVDSFGDADFSITLTRKRDKNNPEIITRTKEEGKGYKYF